MAVLEDLLEIVPVERLNADGVPSASIAILEHGKISAAVITSSREDTETVYQACSISKAITALAVAKLVDDGHFTYDTRVAEHLPRSVIDCITETSTAHLIDHVTIKMLVSHTSGLSQHSFPGYAGDLPTAEDILAGRAPSNTPKIRFNSFPGAQFSYSGGGFTLLQVVLEGLMQMPFPEIMQQTVLRPLAMTRSHYGALSHEERNYATAHYTAYTKAGSPYHRFVELAAAGLWTTPSDLVRAIAAIQQSLHSETGFLKKETAHYILTQMPQTDAQDGMALGWSANASTFAHSGDNDPGYQCYAFGFHDGMVNVTNDTDKPKVATGNGLAIMSNSVLGFDAIRKIVSAVFYLKNWPRFRSLPSHFGKEDYVPYAAPEGAVLVDTWRDWCGQWSGGWQLEDNGGPCLTFQDSAAMRLRAAAAPTRDEDGEVVDLMVIEGLETAIRLTWEGEERVVELIQCEATRLLKRM
ncbi:hypothetical protein LTR08_000019 [Meristemomyces frigidus]|nr:hypothetical protein LTR08_000019 [Meristemomyces frigidus]